ncbi:MAG: hypothetical protein ACTSRO_12235 [Candidatus Heimdallarchaeaceae archaeon]
MKNPWLFLNNLTVDSSQIDSDTTVILGFTGFGSVGTAVLNHIVEQCQVKSIGYWGTMSWFHKNNLESPITIYKLNLNSDDDSFLEMANSRNTHMESKKIYHHRWLKRRN